MHQDGRLGGGEGGRKARQHQGGVGRLDLQPHQRLGGGQNGTPARRYVRRQDGLREHRHRAISRACRKGTSGAPILMEARRLWDLGNGTAFGALSTLPRRRLSTTRDGAPKRNVFGTYSRTVVGIDIHPAGSLFGCYIRPSENSILPRILCE